MYVIYNGELLHYGVPGMKWGKRKAYAKMLTRAGKRQGRADYYRDRGNQAYKKHDDNAKVLDKAAASYEAQGKYFRAEAARKSAAALRARGANIKGTNEATANKYQLKADHYNQKASKFASKKKLSVGKDVVDGIFGNARQKSYGKEQKSAERARENDLRDKLGDDNYRRLNKLRGRG